MSRLLSSAVAATARSECAPCTNVWKEIGKRKLPETSWRGVGASQILADEVWCKSYLGAGEDCREMGE